MSASVVDPRERRRRPPPTPRTRQHAARVRRRPSRWWLVALLPVLALAALSLAAPSTPNEPLWEQMPPVDDGFAATMGYTPTRVTLADGTVRLGRPDGTCSGLGNGGPLDLTPVCQAHDHAYDLLRDAGARGQVLAPEVRKQADAIFARDLRAHCATHNAVARVACHAVARVAIAAVQLNSWRQGYGVPDPEPVGTWFLGATILGGAIASLVRWRRRLSARVAVLVASTPADRDRYVDLLRTASLIAVVVGHWLMMVVTRTSEGLVVDNLLAVVPSLQPVTWMLQVMPVFFFVGGFANLVTWRGVRSRGGGVAHYLARRAERLVIPALAFTAVWVVGVPALTAAGLEASTVSMVARVAAQPLWFLGVYLAASAMVPAMAALHDRYGGRIVAWLAAAVVVVDVARFGLGWPAIGWLNLALVWLCVQQAGFGYADGRFHATPRWKQMALVLGGLGALLMLTTFGPYPVSMVGVPGAAVSNMTPPTFAILALGTWQLGLVLVLRRPFTRWLARPRVWGAVVVAGSLAMTLFLWHLTAAIVAMGFAVAGGVPLPAGGTWRWWLERPMWLLVLAVVVLPVALAASRLERWRPALVVGRGARGSVGAAVAGVAAAVVGFGWIAANGFAEAGPVGLGLLLTAALLTAVARHHRPTRPLVTAGMAPGAHLSEVNEIPRESGEPVSLSSARSVATSATLSRLSGEP